MNSHPLKGPLILIAAAIIWNGSAVFYTSARYRADYTGNGGIVAACVLLLWGVIQMVRGR